jgi:hypothetical protein
MGWHAPNGGRGLSKGDDMPERRPLLRDLIQTFFADYLRLVEPDSAARMRLDRITFPEPGKRAECPDDDFRAIGVVAEVPSLSGEMVTVLVQIEPEALTPPEVGRRLGHYLMGLEIRYGQPVLLSVLFLRGGRPGVRLESAALAEVCGIELARIFFTSFGLGETRAEAYLDRPEPLAWAFAALMQPTQRTPDEHRCACLERIAVAPLDEGLRRRLQQAAECFLESARG